VLVRQLSEKQKAQKQKAGVAAGFRYLLLLLRR
jgi:hypothetical protein